MDFFQIHISSKNHVIRILINLHGKSISKSVNEIFYLALLIKAPAPPFQTFWCKLGHAEFQSYSDIDYRRQ